MRLSFTWATSTVVGMLRMRNQAPPPATRRTTRAVTRAPIPPRARAVTSISPRMRPHSWASSAPAREDSMSATEGSTKRMRWAPTRMRLLWRSRVSTTGSPSTRVPLVEPRSRRT